MRTRVGGAEGFAIAAWISRATSSIRIFTTRPPLPAEVTWCALDWTVGVLTAVLRLVLLFPITTDPGRIRGTPSLVLLGLSCGLMVWGLVQAVGGRSLLPDEE